MNIQTLQINNQTMSSREIADLCEKQHGHVKRDIETMCQQIEIDASKFGYTYIDASNRRQFEYMLDKDLTITLVAGYNAQLRYRIVKRWQALEANTNSPVIPQNFADALQLAADQARQLELAKPKISHYDNVVERAGLLNATQVAQKVRLSAVAMNKVLDELGVYNKAVKRSRVFQQWFIDKGLGEVKQTDQGFSQALFTKRGEAWIIERLISEGVA